MGRVEGPFWARPPKGGTDTAPLTAPLGRVKSIGGGFQSPIRRYRHSTRWLSLKWVQSHRRRVVVCFEAPKPLTIWAELHRFGSSLVVWLRAGSGPLRSVEFTPWEPLKPAFLLAQPAICHRPTMALTTGCNSRRATPRRGYFGDPLWFFCGFIEQFPAQHISYLSLVRFLCILDRTLLWKP